MGQERVRDLDDLIPIEEVSPSLKDALEQGVTPEGCARATAETPNGRRYLATLREGKVFIERMPYGRVSLPIDEPPGLSWKPKQF